MTRGPVLAALLLLAACGSASEPANGAADANLIERLARPKVEKSDPRATARLQRLTREDLEREGLLGAGCAFSRDGQMLLAVVGSDALVRISGQRRHLIHSAPAGATGGFFEDRQIAVSVGRTDEGDGPPEAEAGPAPGAAAGWPARLKVVNRRTEAEVELRGVWTCAR